MSTDVRWGMLKGPSSDKGPHKLATAVMDGKEIDVQVFEVGGVEGIDVEEARAIILIPNGDAGQALAFVMPPPADRTDKQRPGERTYRNHITGNAIKHDADGNTTLNTKAETKIEAGTDCIIRSNGGKVRINP